MNTNIINIDSDQIPLPYVASNQPFSKFKYLFDPNKTISGERNKFVPIKNIVSIEISNISFNYTNSGSIIPATNKFNYRLLLINNYNKITYNSSSDGKSYTTKLVPNDKLGLIEPTPRLIEFNQPVNLSDLTFNFFKEDGSSPSNINDLFGTSGDNSERYHFALIVKSINNSTLKNYENMFNFSHDILERLAYTKILNENVISKKYDNDENKESNNYLSENDTSNLYNNKLSTPIESLVGNYSDITNNIENQKKYNHNGNRINFNYNGFINN